MQDDTKRMQKQLQTKKVLGEFSQLMHSLEDKNYRQYFRAVKLWDAFSDGLLNGRIHKNLDEIAFLGVFALDALPQVITIAHEYQTRRDIGTGKVDAKCIGKRILGHDIQGTVVSKLINQAVSLGANTNNFFMTHPKCVISDMSKAASAIEFAMRKNNFLMVKLLLEPKQSIDRMHVTDPILHLAFSAYEPIDSTWDQSFIGNHSDKNKIRKAYMRINRRFIQNYIVDKTKDANLLNGKLQNVLHVMACEGETVNIPMLKQLIQKGLMVNQRDDLGETPLHIMAREGHCKNVEILKMFNPDWNVRNYAGQTPLHIAARVGDVEMFTKLCSCGADPAVIDFQEKVPSDYLSRELKQLKERELSKTQQEFQEPDSCQHQKKVVENNAQFNVCQSKNRMVYVEATRNQPRLSCWQTYGKSQKSFSSTSLSSIQE